MVGASKILTVSYGTFSCTLEGFDDPFNTMKAIAEYFRDLAAEDRYFGAEPPQPDAAMLHKIAEREIQRRVEAKIQENGVILRAGDQDSRAEALAAPAAAPPAEAPAPTAAVAAPVVSGRVEPTNTFVSEGAGDEAVSIRMPARPEAADEDENRAAPSVSTAPEISESVAAKLSRIRAAQSAAVATKPVATVAFTDIAPEQPAVTAPSLPPQAAAIVFPEIDASYVEDEHAGDEMADVLAQLAADESSEVATEAVAQAPALAEPAEDVLPEDVPMDADVAVVSADLNDLLPEDFAAATEDVAQDDLAADMAPDMAADLAADVAASDSVEPQDDEALDDFSSLLASLDAPAEAVETPRQEPAAISAADFDDEDDFRPLAGETEAAHTDSVWNDEAEAAPSTDIEAEAAAETDADDWSIEDLPADDLPEIEPVSHTPTSEAATPEEARSETPDATPTEPEEAPQPAPDVAEKIQRARARVIKIRRAVPQDAPVESPATSTMPAAAALDVPETDSGLSPEAEADLMRELAALEADGGDDPARPVVRPTRPVLPNRPGRRTLERNTGDEAMTRIIAKTDSEMEGPENRRRLSAIAHLKAAVAATVAERKVSGEVKDSENDRIDPYRNDLSRIVRASMEPAARPSADRPAPLVLVSEQRVDRRTADAAAPARVAPAAPAAIVQPRRIPVGGAGQSATAIAADDFEDEDETDDNIFVDTAGFAEFADRLGAENLSDLLEAAAAYTATVEGRPHFTRPQIIRQISALEEAAGHSREDSLRSFGGLLRAGKIAKVKRGQYALTDLSHILVEAKKLVG